MTFSAIIFDWAGTMVDFGSLAPVAAMRAAFASERIALTDAQIRAAMGMAKRDHVSAILAEPDVAHAWRDAHAAAANDSDIDRIFARLDPMLREAAAAHADLIPGAAETAALLKRAGVRIGSTTGYTRAMMAPILASAAAQGYAPEVVVCAGETPQGRPSPFMVWTALMQMGVWPTAGAMKVDDAPVGIAEGKNAGCYTIGVAASGNAMGLSLSEYSGLPEATRMARLAAARVKLLAAGADVVIDTIAQLPSALEAKGMRW
jgi:phosphonoacetaldehyde hydrolase